MMSSKGKKRKSDRRLDERDLDYFDDGKLPPDHVRDNDDDGDGDCDRDDGWEDVRSDLWSSVAFGT